MHEWGTELCQCTEHDILFSFFYVIDLETSTSIDYEYIFQQSSSATLKQQLIITLLIYSHPGQIVMLSINWVL